MLLHGFKTELVIDLNNLRSQICLEKCSEEFQCFSANLWFWLFEISSCVFLSDVEKTDIGGDEEGVEMQDSN